MTATDTAPTTELELGDPSLVRHLVPRVTPAGVTPAEYSTRALCGEAVDRIVGGGTICEACLEVEKTIPREPRR